MKLVTIAIPIYNAERYLRDAIQSVINQTYKDWILYLINDGSSDQSISIMQEFVMNDSRIKIINDGLNKGLVTRLNQSIELTETKYYARMDADDIMSIYRIEEQVKFLEENPDVDVCGTSIMTINSNNIIIGSGFCEGATTGFIHPTVMGKTKWFKSHLYADWAVRAEDFELWMRTSKMSNFYAIGKPLLFYREFGVPIFSKYYATQKTLLRIYANYKTYDKSIFWSIKNSIQTIAKIIISAFLTLCKKTDAMISLRRRKHLPKSLWLTNDDIDIAIHNPHK